MGNACQKSQKAGWKNERKLGWSEGKMRKWPRMGKDQKKKSASRGPGASANQLSHP
jgi:hypothetical protein